MAGDNRVTSRATTGKKLVPKAPGSDLEQLPAEYIVQSLGHELGLGG